jgi:enterochelin esterase-like enzyme
VDASDLCQPFACPDRLGAVVSKQYLLGTEAPFIVGTDGPDRTLFTALDNLIAEHRVPVMMAISIGNGSGDARGNQRGREYDTMSGLYAEFVEKEVLSLVEKIQREADQGSRRAGRRRVAAPAERPRWRWPGITRMSTTVF